MWLRLDLKKLLPELAIISVAGCVSGARASANQIASASLAFRISPVRDSIIAKR